MNGRLDGTGTRGDGILRLLLWGGAVALMLLPAIAMQFTEEVDWDALDFLVAGVMLATVCGLVDLALRRSGGMSRDQRLAYRAGAALAALTGFLETWANLAVGFLGEPENPANLIYFGIVGIAVIGALLSRLRPHGLAVAMTVIALAQLGGSFYALATGHLLETAISLVFSGMWIGAAWSFRLAERRAP
ncbi:hypothetical protein [Arenimonas fontis]|uniref:Uncharacterized protein n=1 Tax=Arenimonas fontis TaxID=2608255 RepID=A0A5B2ZDE9_9GAMM|nr:hypothetical protein [Arenimonas fontis]KAA2285965.1 hypothetical protein F0415_00210 [Arenimonas fontis]